MIHRTKSFQTIPLQIWAPYDLGPAGFATFATKEDPDPAKRPQLILQLSDQAPTMSRLSNVNMAANTQLGPLPLTVADTETAASGLRLFAASSNPALLPAQNVVFGGVSSTRTLTLFPLRNQTGVAVITIYLSDGVQTNSQTFTVRVGLASIPPVVSAIPDQVLLEHTSSPHVPFTITDSYGRAGEVQISGTTGTGRHLFLSFGSDDPPNAPTNTSHRYVVFTPAAGFTGIVSNVIFTFSDGFNSLQRTVRVTVNPVDDPPAIHLVEPAFDQSFVSGQPLTLQAVVVDRDGDLARVEFYNRGAFLGAVTNAPYQFVWTQPPDGGQPVTGVAVEAAGRRTESVPVIFEIGEPHESPAFLAVRPNGTFLDFAWDSDGRNMQLQQTAALTPSTTWSNVTGFSNPTNAYMLTVPREQNQPRFFRLIEVP